MTNKQTQTDYVIPLTWDYAFKNVFGRYGNEDILRRFLSAILKENITNVTIQNGELPKDTKDKKLGILDIRAEIDNKYLVDIEMQVGDEKNITERALYYLSKLYSGQINQNEEYQEMKKTIVIAILNFCYYNRAEYHSVAHMKFENNNNKEERLEDYKGEEQELVTDKLEYHVIDLKRFKQKKKTEGELADWINLILGEKEKIKMVEKKNKEIEKATKVVEEMGQDPETRELYRLIQKGRIEENTRMRGAREDGYEQAKKEYEQKNKKLEKEKKEYEQKNKKIEQEKKELEQEKIEIANKLIKMNIKIKDIEKITGLTAAELTKMQSNLESTNKK